MPAPTRVVVTGRSLPGPCGVRDYATLLAAGLDAELVWVEEPAPRTLLAALRADLRQLRTVRSRIRPGDVVVVNYSPFAMSWRGIPLLVPLLPLLVRRRGGWAVVVLHELAYSWGRGGLRGLAWAASQRVALLPLVRGSSAVVVATDGRAHWLRRRLRIRPPRLAVVPVWSNMPRTGVVAPTYAGDAVRLGCFGWGAVESRERALALDALAGIGRDARLVLVGGLAASPARDAWYADAAARGVADRLEATGPLAADDVSGHLRALDVYLHLDSAGPAAWKGSLAAALALGLPIVALDGPHTWAVLRETGAVCVVPHRVGALVAAVTELLDDPVARAALQARALSCYDEHSAFDRALVTYRTLLDVVRV